jgi:hypothetical protein
MIELLAKLLIAHFAGDFILFRKESLKNKGSALWRSGRLVGHAFLHFVFAWTALGSADLWLFALLIGASHYFTEVIIHTLFTRHPQIAFGTDQAFHLVLICLVAAMVKDPLWPDQLLQVQIPWISIAGIIAVTFPAAKIIEVFLSRWPPAKAADKLKGLSNAGLWIGILERILVYILIISGHWEGIGFLLAAKSIFRFGDLTSSKDISLTEYIMVGTLMSFCLAVITGLAVIQLKS